MTGLRRALVLVGLLGVFLIAIGVALAASSDHINEPGVSAAVGALVMASYIFVGLYAWWRRPNNRVGALMTAVGFVAFFQALSTSNSPLFFTIGLAFGSVYLIVAVHMLLAFPTGRIPTRAQRNILIAGYAVATVGPLLFQFFSEDCGCPGDHPDNALLITHDEGVASAIDAVSSVIGIGLIAAIGVVLVRRWRAAGPRDRSALSPVLWTGAAMVTLLAVLLAADSISPESDATEAISLAALAAFAALPFAYLTGLMRSRSWRTGAVTELVETLGQATERGGLRDALADALGDPSLQIAYWLPESREYVDEEGRPVALPGEDDPDRATTEVEREGRCVGMLIHDQALCDEPELVNTVAAAAALAIENERLDAELRARVEELRRSRQRLLEAGMSERRRLERDLHDGAQQRLVSLSLQLGLVSQQLERNPAAARELLDGARTEARAALEDLRELARGIHPAVLTDRGLGPALEALADRAPLPVEVVALPDERLPGAVEAAAYFVVSESLTNIAKYARATHAEVRVSTEHGWTLIDVTDDGVGGADPRNGSGLRGMADRLAALDGRLEIESEPGRGTSIRARVPSMAGEVQQR